MTGILAIYSATFMRYSMAVTPRNYLLFACHFINTGSQLVQGYRWLDYHKWGGKERLGVSGVVDAAKESAKKVEVKAKEVVSK